MIPLRLVRPTLCALFLAWATAVWALPVSPEALPDLEGWTSLSAPKTTPITTPSGDKGTWVQRDYRNAQGDRIHAEWLAGPLVTDWKAPQPGIRGDDAPLGFGATYQTSEWKGCLAILEARPHLGLSLTLSLPGSGVLTLESPTADEASLNALGERILNRP